MSKLHDRELWPPGFDWINAALWSRPGTCPYPLLDDWSAEACIKAGYCGCNESLAQGIEARQGEDPSSGLHPKDESPVGKADAP